MAIEYCAGCLRDDEENKAVAWCSDCGELVCKHCGRAHSRFATPHKVVPLDQAAKLSSSIYQLSRNCETHTDQKIILFCVQHDKIICASCVPESHQNCQSVIPIEKAAKGVKTGTAFEDLERRLKRLEEIVTGVIENHKYFSSQLDYKDVYIKRKISEIRQRINGHLDKIEENLRQELQNGVDNSKQEIQAMTGDLGANLEEIKQWKNDIESLKEHGSDLHLFQSIKYLDRKTNEQESKIQNLEHLTTDISLDFCTSDEIGKFETRLPCFGTIQIEKKSTLGEAAKYLEHKGQCVAPDTKLNISLQSSFNISDLGQEGELGCGCFVPGDRLVLGKQYPAGIVRCNVDGSSVKTVNLTYSPLQISLYDENRALIYLWGSGIQILNLDSLSCGKYLVRFHGCGGITSLNGKIWYSIGIKSLHEIDIEGKHLREISTGFCLNEICLSPDGTIFCSSLESAGEKLYLVTPNGESKFFYKHKKLENAGGVVIDSRGDFLVAGVRHNNIHKISKDGKKGEIVLTSENGLQRCNIRSYNQETKLLMVINGFGKSVLIFKT